MISPTDPAELLRRAGRRMPRRSFLVAAAVMGAMIMGGTGKNTAHADWQSDSMSFFRAHCLDCHSGKTPEAELDLSRFSSDLTDLVTLNHWVRIYDRVTRGEMPPRDAEVLSPAKKVPFLTSLEVALTQADVSFRQAASRRLTRVEYENTIRDLFDIHLNVKETLPQDQQTQGFDTVGSGLGISTEQIEIYLAAADAAIDKALGPPKAPKPVKVSKPIGQDYFSKRRIGTEYAPAENDALISVNGGVGPIFLEGRATGEGTYRIRIHAKPVNTDQPMAMAIYAGDVVTNQWPRWLVGYYDVAAGKDWTVIEIETYLTAQSAVQMRPCNLGGALSGPKKFQGPGMMFGEVSSEGPLEPWPPVSRKLLLGNVNPDKGTLNDIRAIVTRFLPRAFRRTVTPDEIDLYVAFAGDALQAGRPFLSALRLSLQAILTSPEFLFLQSPGKLTPIPVNAARQFALASRLSYFLWGSPPDETLFELARKGELNRPEVLRKETERLLKDPRSQRFVEDFVDQWLNLRSIDETEPDGRLFPEYNESLRYAMIEETRRFFREMFEQDRPVQEFIDSNWTILNERLAEHYSIDGVKGTAFRKVTLPKGSVRGGVLTQASILKVTANGSNTSPVVRGTWVLENIMGEQLQPPPPNLPAIEPDIRGATTIREQLAKHRNVASCMACHQWIDPPGFALEAFDPIGGAREWYRVLGGGQTINVPLASNRHAIYRKGPNVDDSGNLADGTKFNGIVQFKKLMLKDRERITRCLTEKLLVYSLGRETGFSDRPQIEAIVANVQTHQDGFRSLIHEIVQSEAFQKF